MSQPPPSAAPIASYSRSNACDQPRPQIAGAERLVIGQAREIAEEPMKTAQPARLDRRHALPGTAPLGRDLVIEKGEARIGELQQPQTQEAGGLDRAMRVLDAR
jgi:hypothetical protein